MNRKKGNALIIILVVLALIGSATTIFFFRQNKQIQNKPVKSIESQKTNPPVISSPTANWKTYSNSVQNYTFRYPSDWEVNQSQANEQQNSLLELTKEQAKFTIYANLYGIGGIGRDYEGTNVTVGNMNLYEYNVMALDGKTQTLGITDTLRQSLGVFQRKGKTYSISLSYPASDNQNEKSVNLKKEFDQILSTFKFTDSVNSSPICDPNYEINGVKVSGYYECAGFNILIPDQLLMDLPSIIVNASGKLITSCGGMPGPNGQDSCPKKYEYSKSCKKITCD